MLTLTLTIALNLLLLRVFMYKDAFFFSNKDKKCTQNYLKIKRNIFARSHPLIKPSNKVPASIPNCFSVFNGQFEQVRAHFVYIKRN